MYAETAPIGKLFVFAGAALAAFSAYAYFSPPNENPDDDKHKKEKEEKEEPVADDPFLSETAAVCLFFVAAFSFLLGLYFLYSPTPVDGATTLTYNFASTTFADNLAAIPAPPTPETIALNKALFREATVWLEKPLSVIGPITHPGLEHKG